MDQRGDGDRGYYEVPRARFSPEDELSRRRTERLPAFQRLVPLLQSPEQQHQTPQPHRQTVTGNTRRSPSPQGFPIYEYSDTSLSSTPSPSLESSPTKARSQPSEAQTATPAHNRGSNTTKNKMANNSSPSGFSPKGPNWARNAEQERDNTGTFNTIQHIDNPTSTIPSTLPFPLISLAEAQRRARNRGAAQVEPPAVAIASTSGSVAEAAAALERPATPPATRNIAETIRADFPHLADKMWNIELTMASLRQQREDIKQLLGMKDSTLRNAALKSLDRKARENEENKILSVTRIKTVVSIMPTVQVDLNMPKSPMSLGVASPLGMGMGVVSPVGVGMGVESPAGVGTGVAYGSPLASKNMGAKKKGYIAKERAAALKDEEDWKCLEKEIEEGHEKLRRATSMLERMKLHFPGAAEMIEEEEEDVDPEFTNLENMVRKLIKRKSVYKLKSKSLDDLKGEQKAEPEIKAVAKGKQKAVDPAEDPAEQGAKAGLCPACLHRWDKDKDMLDDLSKNTLVCNSCGVEHVKVFFSATERAKAAGDVTRRCIGHEGFEELPWSNKRRDPSHRRGSEAMGPGLSLTYDKSYISIFHAPHATVDRPMR
ncbi:hypothetical protein QBC34DRAFT_429784 [Podospora aff. communis PSN243]|uniref:GATA-type domain-containing protein n=1 Tax=Podospora aff. communis PSN243 TaxID=3040156 RepID=A0AAV9G852_9PEZI|nr:hypothetical protein QBC34DRAFT_429784 [Podospora aff. communis PSN243]